jgi:hypothetical protein
MFSFVWKTNVFIKYILQEYIIIQSQRKFSSHFSTEKKKGSCERLYAKCVCALHVLCVLCLWGVCVCVCVW